MDFVDETLVQLADEQTRPNVFDSEALEQILGAAYDVDAMGPLQGTFAPIFDEFELGFSAPRMGVLDGAWNPISHPDQRSEGRFRLTGMADEGALRVDAVWRGSILARYAEANDPILDFSMALPDREAVDAEVAAAHGGSLPTGPTLEQERKTALLNSIKASISQPAAFTEDSLDALRKATGANSIGALLDRLRNPELGFAQVVFPDPAPVSTVRRPLPVATALLIRDQPISVASLLWESKILRDRLTSLGVGLPKDEALRLRFPLVITWIVPSAVFTDGDWPGQDAAERRTNAGTWLAREGIGLVAK
jgi:hypothetical protein